jgi:hypothetical protein
LTVVGTEVYVRHPLSNIRSIPVSAGYRPVAGSRFAWEGVVHRGDGEMSKRYDEEVDVRVERDAGMPSAFVWRGRRYEVADVIGKWRIEGRWWADGRDREYWRVEARGGAVWDLYHDRLKDRWHMERLWD